MNDFDLVDQNLDLQLELEKQAIEHRLQNLSSDEVQDAARFRKVSSPKNAFNTSIKITEKSTTVELLKYNGCVSNSSNDSVSTELKEEQETQEPQETQHPQTIRAYVAGMLAFFSNLRVEYLSNGKVFTRKLPVFYGNREKLLTIEEHEFSDLMNGNTNYLPRASLSIESMTYDSNRQQNKNAPVANEMTYASLAAKNAFSYVQQAPSPYNIAVRLNIATRGMQDAMMLVEQVASYFNPFYTFNLVENNIENSVRLQLEGVSFEHPELDQYSNNEFLVEFNFVLYGNMYKPRTKEFIVDTITVNI